jgi:type IV pilus assembly protein PilE
LVELLVVVAMVGILLAVALPSFNDSVRKSRRAEAQAAVVLAQQAQERFRGNNASYAASLTAAPTATPPGLGLPGTTPGGYYTMSIASADAISYVVTAVAVSGKSQANDSQCKSMAARMNGGNITYAGCGSCSSFSASDFAATHVCWAQ